MADLTPSRSVTGANTGFAKNVVTGPEEGLMKTHEFIGIAHRVAELLPLADHILRQKPSALILPLLRKPFLRNT